MTPWWESARLWAGIGVVFGGAVLAVVLIFVIVAYGRRTPPQ